MARDLPSGTLTFLFTDVEGSTRLLQSLPDQYGEIVETQRRLIRAAVVAHGGVEFGTEGDAVFVAFRRATDGVNAAVEASRALLKHDWPSGVRLRVRMGLHTGDAEVIDDDYVGLALHVAARVCSAAHGGQVLISEPTLRLAPDTSVLDLGEHRLRDVASPVRLYAATAEGLLRDLPPPRTLSARPNNLPAATDEFVGRGLELVDVAEALTERRMVTLFGPGGAGKTRLALEVGAALLPRFPDGVWFVDLSVATAAEQIAALVASALRIGERSGESLEHSILDQLERRNLLLLLDNCEHIVDGVAAFVDRMLRSCEGVHVLATSRELLRVRGERAIPVPPLDEAVELFVVRAQAAVPGFDADAAGRELVNDVCRRLDCLPLAIELATARLRSLSLRQVADRLDDRFRRLTGGGRTSDPRQQTLHAVVAWSHDLLGDEERAVFRRVAGFVGSFDLDGAEAIAGWGAVEPADVLDIISRLADKSLLVTIERPNGYRYTLLETLRQYGRTCLDEAGETELLRDRLLHWARTWVERLEADMRTERQDASLASTVSERANLRAAYDVALDRGDLVEALRIVSVIPILPTRERGFAIERLLDALPDVDDRVRGFALMAAANIAFEQGAGDSGVSYAQAASDLFAVSGDTRLAAWASWFVTLQSWDSGDADFEARARQLVTAFTALGDRLGLAYALWGLSQGVADLDEGDRCAAESEAIFREFRSPIGLAHVIEGRALLALRVDDIERARPFLVEALDIFSSADSFGCTAHVLEATAGWLACGGEPQDAGVLLGAAAELRRVAGHAHRPWERDGRERTEARLRGIDLAPLRAEGSALTFEAAVSRAMRALRARENA